MTCEMDLVNLIDQLDSLVKVKSALVSNWVRVPIKVKIFNWFSFHGVVPGSRSLVAVKIFRPDVTDKSNSILYSMLTRFGLMAELVSGFDSQPCLYSIGVQDPIKSLFLNILPGKIQGIVYQTCTLHFMQHRQNQVQFFIGHDILISCETDLPNNLSTPAWSSSRVGFPGSIPGHAVLMAFSILLSDFT